MKKSQASTDWDFEFDVLNILLEVIYKVIPLYKSQIGKIRS
jgi:hypothetical protein